MDWFWRLFARGHTPLLRSRVAIENEIRGTLKAFGLKVGPVTVDAFKDRVIELTADHPRLAEMMRPMLAAREALQLQSESLHAKLLKAVRSDAVCRRLLSVPGVGPVTALAYATAIDAPARFVHSRAVGAHLGLTPRKYASGGIASLSVGMAPPQRRRFSVEEARNPAAPWRDQIGTSGGMISDGRRDQPRL